ncbi:MAG: hypothetical protein V3V16_15825 [Melioribacteraceae bacterium]
MKNKNNPPLKTIRNFCLKCCNNQPKEVKLCTCNKPDNYCVLYPYRFGNKPKNEKVKLTPIKAIREKCVDCSVYELGKVSGCIFDGKQEDKCSLYNFRMGKNLNRKGIGGNPNFKKHNSTPQIE